MTEAKVRQTLGVLVLLVLKSGAYCPQCCTCTRDLTQLMCSGIDISGTQCSLKHLYTSSGSLFTHHFSNQTRLMALSITDTQLTRIGSESFVLTQSLVNLALSRDQIRIVQPYAFAALTDLKTLDLSRNYLINISRLTANHGNLSSIDLSNNRLTYIGNGLRNNRNVTVGSIDASHNAIDDIDFSEMWYKTKALILKHNRIHTLPPTWADGLIDLEHLDISHNNISQLRNDTFTSLRHLRHLDLSNNSINYLPSRLFVGLVNLRELNLDHNPIVSIHNAVFRVLACLETLSISHMPQLTFLYKYTFRNLSRLSSLNISDNAQLSFVHHSLLTPLNTLRTLDLRNNHVSAIVGGVVEDLNLTHAYLSGNILRCDCNVVWILRICRERNSSACSIVDYDLMTCVNATGGQVHKLKNIDEDSIRCGRISAGRVNFTKRTYQLGSTALLNCDIKYDKRDTRIVWTTPHGIVKTYHNYHQYCTIDLPEADVMNTSSQYHAHHEWHKSNVYWQEFGDFERVSLLKNGSLFIDYVISGDAGLYQCGASNALNNASTTVKLALDHSLLLIASKISIAIGFSTALTFFIVTVTIQGISLLVLYCIKLRKEHAVKKIIESLDSFKTLQMIKLREMGAHQMEKFRDQYHHQLDRLRDNYNQRMLRIKENCAMQMDRLRDNYAGRISRLKNYSSYQLYRLRDNYNVQMVRVRDYSSQQIDRLRENYRLQQQHMLKIFETMHIENCRTTTNTERMAMQGDYCEPDVIIFNKDEPRGSISSDTLSESDYQTAVIDDTTPHYSPDVQRPILNGGHESNHTPISLLNTYKLPLSSLAIKRSYPKRYSAKRSHAKPLKNNDQVFYIDELLPRLEEDNDFIDFGEIATTSKRKKRRSRELNGAVGLHTVDVNFSNMDIDDILSQISGVETQV